MLTTIIRKNSYQDSITLMLLTNHIAEFAGVDKVSIMMGTPANKDILAASGLGSPELEAAGANDIAIALEIAEQSDAAEVSEAVLSGIDVFLAKQSQAASGVQAGACANVRSWEEANEQLPDANLVLFSIPGAFVEAEAQTALEAGKHVFIFSDNVSLEAEQRLKSYAAKKGLLVMGPDCGTAIIDGVPLAFSNVVTRGNIGIVGASGTGIQEVACQIARLGGGISQAIGTGGRDINQAIDASTMRMAIAALDADSRTDCIVVVSKPPAQQVLEKLVAILGSLSKPVVAHFVGADGVGADGAGVVGASLDGAAQRLYFAQTLEETARLAVALTDHPAPAEPCPGELSSSLTGALVGAAGAGVLNNWHYQPRVVPLPNFSGAPGLVGLYTGGTLASEAAVIIERALGVRGDHSSHVDGYVLQREGFTVIDLGDDVYTQGKPHPMIAPQNRVQFITQAAQDSSVGIILLDFVLGYGAHLDMAGETAPAIRATLSQAAQDKRDLRFIASICGTDGDPQSYAAQKAILQEAGVTLCESNASAVATALALLGHKLPEAGSDGAGVGGGSTGDGVVEADGCGSTANVAKTVAVGNGELLQISTNMIANKAAEAVMALLQSGPRVINVGLRSFTEPLTHYQVAHLQFDWQPLAGGDLRLQQALSFLNRYENLTEVLS